jgi:aquaporin Z
VQIEPKKIAAEFIGTAVLVIVAVGVATLSFGFHFAGLSTSAGIVATALAFGLVLGALVYAIGPISGSHVNPAVTMGFVISGRMGIVEAIGYWVAQVAGGIAGAVILWGIFEGSPLYSTSRQGLGTDGYGAKSMVHLSAGGAFGAEVVLTFIFVSVVLFATSKISMEGFAGIAIGFALTVVHLVGIPLTGTSVNPARSIGPALIVGGTALSQLWVFIVAPLIGGFAAALVYSMLTSARAVTVPADEVPADSETS